MSKVDNSQEIKSKFLGLICYSYRFDEVVCSISISEPQNVKVVIRRK